MWRTRLPILLLIACLIAGLGIAWRLRRKAEEGRMQRTPHSLPQNFSAQASDWQWSHTMDNRTVVDIRARDFRQVNDPPRVELENVEIRIYKRDGKGGFDRVRSVSADFYMERKVLHSEGDVEITMGEVEAGAPPGRLVHIKTSDATFATDTGKASTDKPAAFTFDQGDGSSVGASYDPSTRDLRMYSQVVLNWRGKDPRSAPMHVEAGELSFNDRDSKVFLTPWARLTRGPMNLKSGSAVVTLENGVIRLVEAQNAAGTERGEGRDLDYEADQIYANINDSGAVERIQGLGKARLVSRSDSARTTTTADRLELVFAAAGGDSVLQTAGASGSSVVESVPVVRAGGAQPETRLLKADAIELKMRPGGREIEEMVTHSPGSLEFLPNRAGQRKRRLEAERMTIAYGPANRIRSYRAVSVATRTEAEPKAGAVPPPALTWSQDFAAEFHPETGQLERLEQWNDFRYQEGERRARSDSAVMESAANRMTLKGAARVWDPSGSTSADLIELDQKMDDFTATGNVASTRLPDKKQAGPALVTGDEPIQARAARMTSTGKNRLIRYEGNALAWQGANRVQADTIEIDRQAGALAASGSVVSQFIERGDKRRSGRSLLFTVIRAPSLRYTDKDRMAHYTGGVVLSRPALEVRSRQLRAFLREGGSDSGLDRAVAEGKVEILQQETAGRTRRGSSEHAEYFPGEERIVLEGGDPVLADSLRGTTTGRKLTYFANNDRLLVDGAETAPAVSRIRRK